MTLAGRGDEGTRARRCAPLVRLARLLARLGVCMLILFIVAGHAGAAHPLLDLFSHFQVLYLALAAGGAIALFMLRSRRFAALSAAACLSPLLLIAPWHLHRGTPTIEGGATLRVMQFNIRQSNDSYAEVVNEVRRHAPDLVIFQEVHGPWHAGLRPLAEAFPHEFFQPAGIVRGNLIMSRHPLANAVSEPGAYFSPGASATLDLGGRAVSLLVAHTWPPSNPDLSDVRNEELARVARRATEMPAPLILLGDLNTSMWSPHYRRFERDSGLVNARRGFGVVATFPMNEYFLLRVPIDHCLVSPDIAVTGFQRGEPCGSDHAPIIVDLALPPAHAPVPASEGSAAPSRAADTGT